MSAVWNCPNPACGAANAPRVRVCESCGHERGRAVEEAQAPSATRCARCHDTSPNTAAFYDDGHPEDRGMRLCPGCWVPALKRRSELDPMPAEARGQWRALVLGGRLPA